MASSDLRTGALSGNSMTERGIREYLNFGSDWSWETDSTGFITTISEQFFDVMQLKPDAVIGKRRIALVSEIEIAAKPEKWRKPIEAWESRQPMRNLEVEVDGPDGTPLFFVVNCIPTFTNAGEFNGYLGSDRGITAQKTAQLNQHQEQQRLRDSEIRSKAMLNAIGDAVITLDTDGIIQSFSPAAERIFGLNAYETINQSFGILLVEQARAEYAQHITDFMESGDMTIIGKRQEVMALHADGTTLPIELTLNWMEVQDGVMLLLSCHDISKRKMAEQARVNLERELLQSQKLESLGTLSGGMAHEINTPVQFLADNMRFLNESFSEINGVLLQFSKFFASLVTGGHRSSDAKETLSLLESAEIAFLCDEIPLAIGQSIEGIDRISQIVHAIKEFSHPSQQEKTLADINHAIETTLTVSQNQWKNVAELITDYDASLPAVPCVLGAFNQVILNLILNSSHAIEETGVKGEITVRTAQRGSSVEIVVEDNGAGIPADIQEKIFEPFFTTKGPGKGTGQGLSIAHTNITKMHGGRISVESEVGKGTVFTIILPLESETELETID